MRKSGTRGKHSKDAIEPANDKEWAEAIKLKRKQEAEKEEEFDYEMQSGASGDVMSSKAELMKLVSSVASSAGQPKPLFASSSSSSSAAPSAPAPAPVVVVPKKEEKKPEPPKPKVQRKEGLPDRPRTVLPGFVMKQVDSNWQKLLKERAAEIIPDEKTKEFGRKRKAKREKEEEQKKRAKLEEEKKSEKQEAGKGKEEVEPMSNFLEKGGIVIKGDSSAAASSVAQFQSKPFTLQSKDPKNTEITDVLAIHCIMVGAGHGGSRDIVGRIAVVNEFGNPLLDTFINPAEPVTDYRTQFTGITEESLKSGVEYKRIANTLYQLIESRIVVGFHAGMWLKSMMVDHSRDLTRDLRMCPLYRDVFESSRQKKDGEDGKEEEKFEYMKGAKRPAKEIKSHVLNKLADTMEGYELQEIEEKAKADARKGKMVTVASKFEVPVDEQQKRKEALPRTPRQLALQLHGPSQLKATKVGAPIDEAKIAMALYQTISQEWERRFKSYAIRDERREKEKKRQLKAKKSR